MNELIQQSIRYDQVKKIAKTLKALMLLYPLMSPVAEYTKAHPDVDSGLIGDALVMAKMELMK